MLCMSNFGAEILVVRAILQMLNILTSSFSNAENNHFLSKKATYDYCGAK